MGVSTVGKHKLLPHHRRLSQFFQSAAWPHYISWQMLSSQSIVSSPRTVRPSQARNVQSMGRSMDWKLEDNIVNSLIFFATLAAMPHLCKGVGPTLFLSELFQGDG